MRAKRHQLARNRATPERPFDAGLTRILDGKGVGEAEAIALRLLEERKPREPAAPRPVTLRKFSWEKPDA